MPANGTEPVWVVCALGSPKHLFFAAQICPEQPEQGASWWLQRWQRGQRPNVTRQPCCHSPVAQRASCARSLAGAAVSSPWAPSEPEPGRGRTLRTLLSRGFWKERSLPASRTRVCTNAWAGALLSHELSAQPRRQNSCKPHPGSSQHHLLPTQQTGFGPKQPEACPSRTGRLRKPRGAPEPGWPCLLCQRSG